MAIPVNDVPQFFQSEIVNESPCALRMGQDGKVTGPYPDRTGFGHNKIQTCFCLPRLTVSPAAQGSDSIAGLLTYWLPSKLVRRVDLAGKKWMETKQSTTAEENKTKSEEVNGLEWSLFNQHWAACHVSTS